jgi:hypothetical protein
MRDPGGTIHPRISEAIFRVAARPWNPLEWFFRWGGRIVIFVGVLLLSIILSIITFGGSPTIWRWPFVMLGRWYWYDHLVRVIRQELAAAIAIGGTASEIAERLDSALVRRGVQRAASPEAAAFVKNETVDVAKLVAADYIVNGRANPTDTLNDIRKRRDKAVAPFNAMAPQILEDLKQQPEPQRHYTRLGYAGIGRELRPKPRKPLAPARLGD